MTAFAASILTLVSGGEGGEPGSVAPLEVHARVVGIVQDGGLPHLGCTNDACRAARRDPSRAERVASLAIIARRPGVEPRVYLLDATPDFRSQVDSALESAGDPPRPPRSPVDGVFLTHAHIGHYTGLVYLGKESMAAHRVAVFGTARMLSFLGSNGPWKRLVADGNIELKPLAGGRRIDLAEGLSVEALEVPHRDEESDAVGFIVRGPARSLLYVPDIDAWDRWDRDVRALVRSVDVALLDGTFFSAKELPGRPMEEIPHPLVRTSMDLLEPAVRGGSRVIFIHLNHTNPALTKGSPERREVEARGFEVAIDGMELPL